MEVPQSNVLENHYPTLCFYAPFIYISFISQSSPHLAIGAESKWLVEK